MRRLLTFIFLFSMSVAACYLPAAVNKQTPKIENTALPTEHAQNTVIPSPTAEAQATVQQDFGLTTFTPAPLVPGPPNVIKFPPNGTYLDLTDNIAFGTSKAYSVNAMKGQIMSISILPNIPDGSWGYVPMQIKGADGTVLCPLPTDYECLFWRGELPSSQDYFVTLTPNGDVPQFVMRVAINPPGKDAQYFQYSNPVNGVSLTYPDIFTPALPVAGNYKSQPEFTLHFIDIATYQKTNLSDVYIFFSSTSDSQIVATCTEPNQAGGGPEPVVGNEVVNGITYVHSTSDGAGAGNYYQQEIYRTVKEGVCHEVIYFIHYTNIGNYPPGTVTEFDRDVIMQYFLDVFETFTIN
jgi:hypothetical protein